MDKNEIAFERFDRVVEEGRYIGGAWHRRGDDGRDYLCLAAAYGEPGEVKSAEQCPVDAFPIWLKELMPTLDDGVAHKDRLWLFKGFAARNRKLVTFDATAWNRLKHGFQIACIRQAVESAAKVHPDPAPAYWPDVQSACDGMIAALESGDEEKIKAASDAASDAAWAASDAAWAANAAYAAGVAWNAANAAWAANAASDAAAANAAYAAWAASDAAANAVYRKLSEALFDLIDAERVS